MRPAETADWGLVLLLPAVEYRRQVWKKSAQPELSLDLTGPEKARLEPPSCDDDDDGGDEKAKQRIGPTYLQEVSAGPDKLSEAERKVLLVGENLCQLHKRKEEDQPVYFLSVRLQLKTPIIKSPEWVESKRRCLNCV